MPCKLETIEDENSITGEIDIIRYAYGGSIPIGFFDINYAGFAPDDVVGRTFQLLVKSDRNDDDNDALINVFNPSLTIETDPLVISYRIDTDLAGFAPNTTLYVELWVRDDQYGRYLIKEFLIYLNDPTKNQFDD